MTSSNNQLSQQLTLSLQARHFLCPSPTWLQQFLSTIRLPPPPLPALTATAHFRLLQTDFTNSLASTDLPANSFPVDISGPTVKQRVLGNAIPVQVLDVIDIGTSISSQLETIERIERGETVKGREVIRTVPVDPSGTGEAVPPPTRSSGALHKLLLQDANGTKVWAFEADQLLKGEDGWAIGTKILLKQGTVVRRGCVMLRAKDVVVWGGKVAEWDERWKKGRKGRLLADLEREQGENGG